MPVRINVSNFRLVNKASPRHAEEFPCTVSIQNIKLERFETRVDRQDFTYPKRAGQPDETDPVKWLDEEADWDPVAQVGEGTGPAGDAEWRQPAGFGKNGLFESLHVSYWAPVTCKCDDGENTRYLRMTVDYDLSSNSGPDLRVEETQADGSPKPGNPDKQLRSRVVSERETTDNRNRTVFVAEVEVRAFIPCKCSDVNPCEVTFTMFYTYRPESV
jgi:hypothetical protein